jgi:CRP/FNR family transcriptional regulator, anaerobic regulatory protein
LNRPALQRLEQHFFDWNTLLGKIIEKSLFDKVRMRNRLFQAAGRERFEIFLAEFPGVANHAKAADVASFLGISQYTLSHLKKEMIKGDGLPHRGN